MSTLKPLTIDQAATELRPALEGVRRSLGKLPNMFGVLAHSPVALNAYLQLAGSAGKGTLSARQRELIALAVGCRNACDYCVAAHTAIGAGVGVSAADALAARRGQASDPRDAALLRLAVSIVGGQGHVPASELVSFKTAGFDDAAILEVLVNVVLNVLTNWTNHLAGTEIDFPLPAAA